MEILQVKCQSKDRIIRKKPPKEANNDSQPKTKKKWTGNEKWEGNNDEEN